MTTTADASPSEKTRKRCRNCGSFVTRQFARVFGDNRDRVHGCLDCTTATAVKRGAAHERRE